MTLLVVSGTGTEVGKTVVTASLAALARERGASTAVLKPAQTGVADGEPGDLAEVARLSRVEALHEIVRYPDPLSPAAAARRSGRAPLDPAAFYDLALRLDREHDLVLVEGAGGLLVRYDEEGTTIADLARGLRAPVLVVAGPQLGTLNHTALTLEALAHRGVELSGVVIGSWPGDPGLAERCNLRDLETLAARPLLGALPAGAGSLEPAAFLEAARDGLAPALGGTFDSRVFRSAWEQAPPTGSTT
ncbi:MAG TPA: dethiobiotin synthase [Mycobacteriales bacterium]|nr:dethiobiotin synthase [Mycobacteriales bacterium]